MAESRPFTDTELREARASELREVRAPKPGDTVEVGFILTDAVLCINRLVLELQEAQRQIELLSAKQGHIRIESSESFKLPNISGEYEGELDDD